MFVKVIMAIVLLSGSVCAHAANAPSRAIAVVRDSVDADSVADAISLQQRIGFRAYRVYLGVGAGSGETDALLSLQAMASYQRGSREFFARIISGGAYSFGGWSFDEWSTSIGLLYGISTESPLLHCSIAAGIGHMLHQGKGALISTDSMGRETFQEVRRAGLCIPLQAQAIVSFPSAFGIGLTAYADLSTVFSTWGVAFHYQFGDWSKTTSIPEWTANRDITTPPSPAQRAADSVRLAGLRSASNAVYVELFGSSALYAVHFEGMIDRNVSVSLGASFLPGSFTIPVVAHVLLFKENSGVELAAGPVLSVGMPAFRYTQSTYLGASLFVGYRYQPFNGGEFVRIGYNPVFIDNVFNPIFFGVSGGWCF